LRHFRLATPAQIHAAAPFRLFGLMKILALGDSFPATDEAYPVPRKSASKKIKQSSVFLAAKESSHLQRPREKHRTASVPVRFAKQIWQRQSTKSPLRFHFWLCLFMSGTAAATLGFFK
jgi:hypothetical protein